MATDTTRISVRDLYESFRGYETAMRYLGDILSGVLMSQAITPQTEIEIDSAVAGHLEATRDGRNHVCDTPPYCNILAQDLRMATETWMSRAAALHNAVSQLVSQIEGQQISYVPSIRPGWNYPGGHE